MVVGWLDCPPYHSHKQSSTNGKIIPFIYIYIYIKLFIVKFYLTKKIKLIDHIAPVTCHSHPIMLVGDVADDELKRHIDGWQSFQQQIPVVAINEWIQQYWIIIALPLLGDNAHSQHSQIRDHLVAVPFFILRAQCSLVLDANVARRTWAVPAIINFTFLLLL